MHDNNLGPSFFFTDTMKILIEVNHFVISAVLSPDTGDLQFPTLARSLFWVSMRFWWWVPGLILALLFKVEKIFSDIFPSFFSCGCALKKAALSFDILSSMWFTCFEVKCSTQVSVFEQIIKYKCFNGGHWSGLFLQFLSWSGVA